MNTAEFTTETTKIVRRAITEGVAHGKMDVPAVIGVLEMQKAEVLRWSQDLSRSQNQPAIVLPAPNGIKLPPGR